MRAIWSGSIGFGLVNIPIKLYSAIETSTLDLDMLDKKDHANIKFQRVNANTGKEVPWKSIVRGYNLDGKYVVLDDKDFERAMPEKTKTIEIASFAELTEIDSVFYETPYYIEPEKNGARAYSLLCDALNKTGKVGVGSFVLRNKEQLCIIKPMDNVLVLQKLHYEEEIRKTSDLNIPSAHPKPAELKMAISLIDQLSGSFDISGFKNDYSEKLLKLIKAKAHGKKPAVSHLKVVHSRAKDLMGQLKASLETKKRKAS
jgi:DNA end-binding protein Ku